MSSSSTSSDVVSDSEAESSRRQGQAQQIEEETANAATYSGRPRHGEKLSFKAPKGYLPSHVSHEVLSIFGRDALKSDSKKQLWAIKIPEGLPPSTLDGLVITVPTTTTSTLAKIQIQAPVRGSATQVQTKSYTLKGRKKTQASKDHDKAVTQLIAMAGGRKASDEDAEELDSKEGDSFQIMVPHSQSRSGRYVFAPGTIKQHLQLVLDAPARADVYADGSTKSEIASHIKLGAGSGAGAKNVVSGEKRQREQPWNKLKGFFYPTGSGSEEARNEPDEMIVDDPTPKAKKSRKGADIVSPKKVTKNKEIDKKNAGRRKS
ncbi:hypothetical protein CBS101457_000458 [Exobasidium rhododendri]|nr:hypothetical protein CBS101457_000458 [Exobasidium rhododendri]